MAASAPVPAQPSVDTTITLLETRLRRLEFLLNGQSDRDGVPTSAEHVSRNTDTVTSRLASLQSRLERLRREQGNTGNLIRDVESLHARVPVEDSSVPSDDSSVQAAVVLAHATLYPETASRLSSLQTLQIPPAEQSAKLSLLKHDIQQAQRNQVSLEDQIEDLRQRSARCLEWWVTTGVVGMTDVFEEWEDRLADIERYIARVERRKKEREGYL